jgi:hypothetical protein
VVTVEGGALRAAGTLPMLCDVVPVLCNAVLVMECVATLMVVIMGVEVMLKCTGAGCAV